MNYEHELREFFSWCASRLDEVLDAGGAREVWLQAEAYRYFRFHRPAGPICLRTNAHKKNDLAFYEASESDEPLAVVEMKLYGLSYLHKNLTGHSQLTPYVVPKDGERFTFLPAHAELCHPEESSILRDYRKLLSQSGRRFMLLVLDTRGTPNAFGDAVQRVDFGVLGTELIATKFWSAKVWEIT